MARGGRGNVDGVNFLVGNQVVGAVVGTRDAVAARIVSRPGAVAAHDGNERGAVRLLEAGPALHFGDVATADDSPAHAVHVVDPYVSRRGPGVPGTSG